MTYQLTRKLIVVIAQTFDVETLKFVRSRASVFKTEQWQTTFTKALAKAIAQG